MQIKKKIFPYPILNNNKLYSNFNDKEFNLVFDPVENEYEYILVNARFITDSDLINTLYEEKKIEVVVIIECSNTVMRKSIEVSKIGKNIILPKTDFSEKVDISMFAYAKCNFSVQSDEYETDYQGINFEFEKYDIIAANDGFNIRFKHEEMEDSLIQSIFSIIVNHDLSEGVYIVECDLGKKISISLSKNDYNNYKIIYTVPTYKEVFFNMLLIPSLIEGLALCKNLINDNFKDLEDVGNQYTWFRSIELAYKKLHGNELKLEDFKVMSPVFLAQELLGKPIGMSLKKLVDETHIKVED